MTDDVQRPGRHPSLDPVIERELATVAPIAAFLGPDALASRLGEIALASGTAPLVLGHSRGGRPIECLTLGDGERDVVVYGLPHPNEPIGGLTVLHLAQRLVGGALPELTSAFRWHLIPCIDPDGLALNEGWLAGPYTLGHYARHFYRPAGDEQVEWAFPLHYKQARFDAVLPETRILMDLVDERRPALVCSLHNSELGGAYYYLSRPEPQLYGPLTALPAAKGIDLHCGEPEAPFIEVFADGVHRWPDAEQAYDHLESLGLDPLAGAAGSAASTYASRQGALTLVSELPYWRDPRAGDASPGGQSLAAALHRQADEIAEVAALMAACLAQATPAEIAASPLLRSGNFFAAALGPVPAATRIRADRPENQREGSVAELRSIADLVDSLRLRYAGMVRRGVADLSDRPATTGVWAELSERYERWLAQAQQRHAGLSPLPIEDLVAVQYGAILTAARHVAARPEEGDARSLG